MDSKDIEKTAHLARIALDEREAEHYATQLSGIFNWVDELATVNTDNVDPMAGVGDNTLRTREDVVTAGNIRDDVLANAPASAFGCFTVPKVIEG